MPTGVFVRIYTCANMSNQNVGRDNHLRIIIRPRTTLHFLCLGNIRSLFKTTICAALFDFELLCIFFAQKILDPFLNLCFTDIRCNKTLNLMTSNTNFPKTLSGQGDTHIFVPHPDYLSKTLRRPCKSKNIDNLQVSSYYRKSIK